jgi:hypothetical protein
VLLGGTSTGVNLYGAEREQHDGSCERKRRHDRLQINGHIEILAKKGDPLSEPDACHHSV